MYKLGLLGAGKMGQSIIRGVLNTKLYQMQDILVFDTNELILESLGKEHFNIGKSEVEIYEMVDIILFAIKPQNFEEVLLQLQHLKKEILVISIAAGIKTDYIKSFLKTKKIIRVMPNTPALVGKGATAISRTLEVSDEEFEIAKKIFSSIGVVEEVKEEQMDDIIPVNGSLPAYVYYYLQGYINSAVSRGIDYDVALNLAAHTLIGSAHMILDTNKSLDELIKDVCSPGGATIEGLNVLVNNNLHGIINDASIKCVEKSIKLGDKK